MKKAKRIRVKVRKAKRAAIADMEKVLTIGQESILEMLNDSFSTPNFQINEHSE